MADYYAQAVLRPSIPDACMTPLERWLLEALFESEPDGNDRTYFFASESISSMADVDEELESILAGEDSPLAQAVRAAIDAYKGMDLGAMGGPGPVLQGIVARHSARLPFVIVETAYTCSRMRADGFGGAAWVIKPTEIRSIDTASWVRDQLKALGLPGLEACDGQA